MNLLCVNCGAPFEGDDGFCGFCGVPRAASLPPGAQESASPPAVSAAAPASPSTEHAPAAPTAWESAAVIDEPAVSAATVFGQPVEPQVGHPAAPPLPEGGPAAGTAYSEPAHARPSYLSEAYPVTQDWSAPAGYDPANGYPAQEPAGRPAIGLVDVLVTMLGLAVTFAIGILLNGHFSSLDNWLYRGYESGTPHALAAWLVLTAAVGVAALAASWSRVPGTGLLAIVLSEAGLLIYSNFDASLDWPLVIMFVGFAFGDLVVLFARHSVGTGLFAGLLGGLGAAGASAVRLQRVNLLDAIVHNSWSVVYTFVVPVALGVVFGLLGGMFASLRKN
jgi:hypothetical protein